MSARNHEVTAKQQLLDANGNIAETVLDAFPMGKLQMPTNSSEGDIVYEKKNLRLKYVLEKNPENLSERSVVGKSIAGKEKTGRNIIICARENRLSARPRIFRRFRAELCERSSHACGRIHRSCRESACLSGCR